MCLICSFTPASHPHSSIDFVASPAPLVSLSPPTAARGVSMKVEDLNLTPELAKLTRQVTVQCSAGDTDPHTCVPNARTHSLIRRVLFTTKLAVSGLKPLAAAHPSNMFLRLRAHVASIHVKVEGDCSCEGEVMPPIEIVLHLCVWGAEAVVWNGSGCEASISAVALLRCKAQGMCNTFYCLSPVLASHSKAEGKVEYNE